MGNKQSKTDNCEQKFGTIIQVSQPSQLPPVQSRTKNVRALYTFSSDNPGDLSFETDDVMFVFSDLKDPWYYAKHLKSNKCGYIPCNYVVIDDGSPTSLECFFNIGRMEAEKKLILPGYKEGTFILRPSTRENSFALSVRFLNPEQRFYVVKNYKIRLLPNGRYCIIERKQFPDVKSLIMYYRQHCDGLCCRLIESFPKGERPPIQFREIEVNRNCLTMVSKLGSGNFGDVWLAKWNGRVEVAVKQLKPNYQDQRKACLDEAKVMHQLRHPHIVEILGICSKPFESPVFIITELMSKGALLDVLRKDHGISISLLDMVFIMNQIADGMSYLESKNFIHRDLRAANILVADDLCVKVADFGLARVIEDVYEANSGSKFPIKWTAPEAGLRQIFTCKSDVWSFGIVMYEIVTYGKTPYPNFRGTSILDALDHGYRMEQPRGNDYHCPPDLYNIMLLCWSACPEDRPSFNHLRDIMDSYNANNSNPYEFNK